MFLCADDKLRPLDVKPHTPRRVTADQEDADVSLSDSELEEEEEEEEEEL